MDGTKKARVGEAKRRQEPCWLLNALKTGQPMLNLLSDELLSSPYDWIQLGTVCTGARHLLIGRTSPLQKAKDKLEAVVASWSDEMVVAQARSNECDIDMFFFALTARGFDKSRRKANETNAALICKSLRAVARREWKFEFFSSMAQLGGMEALLLTMESFLSVFEVQENACHAIKHFLESHPWMHLSKNEGQLELQRRKETILNRCTLCILRVIERYIDRTSVLHAACSALKAVSRKNFVGEGNIMAVGAVDVMVAVAKAKMGDLQLQNKFLGFLVTLTAPSTCNWGADEISEPHCRCIVEARALPVICSAAKLHQTPDLQAGMLRVVGDLLEGRQGFAQFNSLGGFNQAMTCLKISSFFASGVPDVRVQAWRVLRHLSGYSDAIHHFSQANVGDLIAMMQQTSNGQERSAIRTHGARMLGNLVGCNDLRSMVIKDGLALVLQWMEDCGNSAYDIQQACCYTLRQFMTVDAVDTVRSIDAALKAISNHLCIEDCVMDGTDFLKQCCRSSVNISRIMSLHGCEVLLHVLKEYGDDYEDRHLNMFETVLSVLGILVKEDVGKQHILAADGPRVIVRLMAANRDNMQLRAEGTEILKHMSSLVLGGKSDDLVLLTASVLF